MTGEPVVVQTDDGARLSAWASGADDDEAVVLLHGYSLDHTTWEPVADRLTDAGYRVIAVDLRGHGESTLGGASPTVDRFVGDVLDVVRDLGVGRWHLVGHSFGAVVALAARVDDRLGDELASVTSIAGTEQSIQNPVMKLGARFFSSRAGVRMLRRQRTGRLMISSWFGKRPSPDQLDWIRTLSASCDRDTRTALFETTSDIDLRPTFGQPGPPTLVMCGCHDKATPLQFSERIADAIDGSELSVIDDAGHMVIIEQPDAVSDRLFDWIAQHA